MLLFFKKQKKNNKDFEFGGHFSVSIKPLKGRLHFNGKLLDSVPLT